MKQSILNSLTIVLLLLLPVEKTFGQLPELVAKNEKAVFSIYTYDEYGSANGMGTGFFIDGKGIGFTNYHVLEGATKAVIKLTDKSVYEIDKIIAADADADVVKFSVKNFDSRTFSYLTLKTTQPLKGSDIFVIGNPEGFENTVSEGIVSSIREIEGFGDIIQITAPISPGSSGSPVMTMDGKVVGIATFQLKEGQNINFAISCKKALDISSNSEISLANIGSEIIILNLPCETSPQFVLNSIELSESSTILHFSYTNLNIAWGDNGFVFSKVGKKNDGMFITDLSSGMNYYNNYSSIETKKTVKLGETKRYREVFPSLPKSANKLNIVEGEHGHVSFYNIDLDKYREIAGKDVSNYLKNLGLKMLESQDYESAINYFNSHLKEHPQDAETYNMLGVVSFQMDNNYNALKYFSEAIKINSKVDNYYFNRYLVNNKKGDIESAINDISMAITVNPKTMEYYVYRAYLFMGRKEWEKAKKDWDTTIDDFDNSHRDDMSLNYKYRGSCKTWLKDFSGACSDWKYAYKLSKYSDTQLQEWISKNCK